MFTIRTGLNSAFGLSQHALVIVGQNKLIKNFPFGGDLEAKFNGEIDARKWKEAMKMLPVSGSLPLVFNQSRIISVPDSASRHNTPSNCHIISRELKTLPFYKGGFNVNHADNVLASVAAIARSFPLYFRRTGQSPVNIIVEICLPDREVSV
uniref:Pdase_M17_N2 domain-containing protein n=1 Tax=Angiostrongylus cantonensis TaxID=6313 RepID=A0A0K0D4R6_ANGCA